MPNFGIERESEPLVLVNALSVRTQSGVQVLRGFLTRLAQRTKNWCRFLVLHSIGNDEPFQSLGPNVSLLPCPSATRRWTLRPIWERYRLPKLVKELDASLLFTPSGMATDGIRIPQIVFCQNPWCMVPKLDRTPIEKIKALVQRRVYKATSSRADLLLFNSHYMRSSYETLTNRKLTNSAVVHQGIDDDVFRAAGKLHSLPRKRHQVLTVSAMEKHKNVETVLEALASLRGTHAIDASLRLIGAWPDVTYRDFIVRRIDDLNLSQNVQIEGFVPRDVLYRAYAESSVFCLMSRCESFGFPAVEAQAFGTPVVVGNCGAQPEVAGESGIFPDVNDVDGTARAIATLMNDDKAWTDKSVFGIANSKRFNWDACFEDFFDSIRDYISGKVQIA